MHPDTDTAYHVNFDAKGQEFDVGDAVQVTVTLAQKDSALWLPPQAVRAFEGRRFVVTKERSPTKSSVTHDPSSLPRLKR